MPLGVKPEIYVKFNPGFNLFINFHNRTHTPFAQRVFITGFPVSLGDYHHCDGCYHHDDDNVEVIFCQENWQHVGSGNDEVKHKKDKPEPVSTVAGWPSLIFLTINIGKMVARALARGLVLGRCCFG